MQAQTLQDRRLGNPWVVLLVIAILAAVLAVGGQLTTSETGGPVRIVKTVDDTVGTSVTDGTGTWSTHRQRPGLSPGQTAQAKALLHEPEPAPPAEPDRFPGPGR
jgi:hypothetical protein